MHYNVLTETTLTSVSSTTTQKHTVTPESTASTSVKTPGMSVEAAVLYIDILLYETSI